MSNPVYTAMFLVVFVLGPEKGPDISRESGPILSKMISLDERVTTIGQALKYISQRGGFTFSYGNKIPVKQEISLKAGKKSVEQHLNEIFREFPVEYIEKKDKILIVPQKKQEGTGVFQTVRGRILDKDSGLPIPGVNVFIASPLKGTVTGLEGEFQLEEVPVGRHTLKVSCMGYEAKSLPNLVVHSGKETILNFELEESLFNIGEVTILHEIDRLKPVNELAVVSTIPLSAEDLTYCPGGMMDISRVALSLPGVASANDGQNHLIIRGNSPKGIQWRLEGIEIPNMNHFGEIGSSGGGINLVSNNMIGRSDFYTGAFPAEYGNALSGVFDLNLRTGNNQNHEQTFQIGMMGTELMAEGPLNRKTGATYIAQFRFYTMAMIHRLGLIENQPDFADLSFKFRIPTARTGTYSLFGIGGKSHETGPSPDSYHWYNDVATIGLSNDLGINETTRIKTIAAFSFWKYRWDRDRNIGTQSEPIDYNWHSDVRDITPRFSITLNKKLSSKHKLKTGLVYTYAHYNSFMGWHSDTLSNRALDTGHPLFSDDINYEYKYVDAHGSTGIIQAHLNWRYRIFPSLTLNTGLHYIRLFLNNNQSLEPRGSISWEFLPNHILSAGYGIHSHRESFTLYTGSRTLHDGEKVQINRDLDLAKAQHFVLGYHFRPYQGWLLKTEAYYQYLYDIPVYPFPPYFSTINFDFGFEGNILVNKGTGFNRGVELTFDKLFSRGYSFMFTGTVYESKYRNYMEEELPTKYDGSFASSGMFLKEFSMGPGGRNVLGLSSRVLWTGGFRELPIDLEASIDQGREVRIWDNGFTEKMGNYFRIDALVFFRRNKPGYTAEWKVEILNLTNNKNMLQKEYDSSTESIRVEYQNTLIPLLTYRIQF